MHYSSAFQFALDYGWGVTLILGLGVLGWLVARNEDLRVHRGRLAFGIVLVALIPLVVWLVSASTGSRIAGWIAGAVFGGIALWSVLKILDRATNDFLGGLVFDMVFSEGPFAGRVGKAPKLANITLLRHWRETGGVRKAFYVARQSLIEAEEAFPLWLFTAETEALYFGNVRAAAKLIRELFRSGSFTSDQKFFAVQQLKGWAAAKGVHLNVRIESQGRVTATAKPLQEVTKLRDAGQFERARSQLKRILRSDPENLAAAALLVRVYAEDLKSREKAEKAISELEAQPFTPTALTEYLRRSLNEWVASPPASMQSRLRPRQFLGRFSRPGEARKLAFSTPPICAAQHFGEQQPAAEASDAVRTDREPRAASAFPPAVAELLKEGRLGTAVEELEALHQRSPNDLDSILHLIQVHLLWCGNLRTAERLFTSIEVDPDFSEQQKEEAGAKYRLWREQLARVSSSYY